MSGQKVKKLFFHWDIHRNTNKVGPKNGVKEEILKITACKSHIARLYEKANAVFLKIWSIGHLS